MRVKPQAKIHGYYVYVHYNIVDTATKDFRPFFVSYSQDVYEYRRYSNRPDNWNNAILNKEILCSVLFDNIDSVEIAQRIANAVVWYFYAVTGNQRLINQIVEPVKPPNYTSVENVIKFVMSNLPSNKVQYKYNGLTMVIDISKRNYKRVLSK